MMMQIEILTYKKDAVGDPQHNHPSEYEGALILKPGELAVHLMLRRSITRMQVMKELTRLFRLFHLFYIPSKCVYPPIVSPACRYRRPSNTPTISSAIVVAFSLPFALGLTYVHVRTKVPHRPPEMGYCSLISYSAYGLYPLPTLTISTSSTWKPLKATLRSLRMIRSMYCFKADKSA